ncbi:hypothetical protein BaRGS_00021517 [Batillaria attramentaria]|uniref:ShKT domain-containing protein n=1 Tax=Batillaria attramentaria TaxID=370345 RepID=A0ABD0KJF5_9CAEN
MPFGLLQFCQMRRHDYQVEFKCDDRKHIDNCQHHQRSNDGSCNPTQGYTYGNECFFCCSDRGCFWDLNERYRHTTTSTTTAPAPVTNRHCYDNGNWACHGDESCQAMQSLNVHACESTPIDFTAHLLGQCDFCCRDLQCVKSHLAHEVTTVLPVTSQTTPTVTPHTTTTVTSSQAVTSTTMTQLPTAAPHQLPGINSCYTSPCLQGDDPATCTSGQWACGDDQFCQVLTYHDTGTVRMQCTTISLAQAVRWIDFQDDLGKTVDIATTVYVTTGSYVTAALHVTTSLVECTDDDSRHQRITMGCENYHADDACENYKHAGLCTDSYIVGLCQRTCNACGTCYNCTGLDCFLNPTVLECPDHLCMTIVDDAEVREIARRCATKPECDAITSNAVCHDPDHARLGTFRGVTCQFCCNEPNCNSPPDIAPGTGLITQHLVG